MAYPNYINCRSPEPIKTDLLESDIKMLLDNDIITSKQLRQWAEQITKVSAELDKLYSLVEFAFKQRWIPTDQRLPSPQQDVIFIVSADAILDGRKLGGRYLGDDTFSVPGQSFRASHWMPMPSGPEIK